jgi:hypothetical protein
VKKKMRPLPDFGRHMTFEEFEELLEDLDDYDGGGEYATATETSNLEFEPSSFKRKPGFTHVVWYNR